MIIAGANIIKLARLYDAWEVPIAGWDVSLTTKDYSVSYVFTHIDSAVELSIESEYILTDINGNVRILGTIPDTSLKKVDPGLVVERMTVFDMGNIEVNLSDGSVLQVASNENYEAWQIVESNGMKIVSLPGGKLSIWN
jgi:hypothetical protein